MREKGSVWGSAGQGGGGRTGSPGLGPGSKILNLSSSTVSPSALKDRAREHSSGVGTDPLTEKKKNCLEHWRAPRLQGPGQESEIAAAIGHMPSNPIPVTQPWSL